ncbi:hypothetical protein C6P40_003637 [Pichia californica]|uniref:Uncharacterized protein n=1 Tax=Pichia californica TaxID=460514 RepID=A0A9P6WGE9_9ASCO|nr:hypothetical protein C6P40_003637 [[Candida] californica]
MNREELKNVLDENIKRINELDIDSIESGVKNIHGILLTIVKSKDDKNSNKTTNYTTPVDTMNSDLFEISNSNSNSNSNSKKTSSNNFNKFDDFIFLQEDISFNISNQFLKLLIRIENFEFPNDEDEKKVEIIIIQILQILQGILLIHPNSRNIFKGKYNMTIMIKLLNPKSNMRPNFLMIIECVLMLVSLFIRNCENLRNFEELKGIELICGLIKGEYEEDEGDEKDDDNNGSNNNNNNNNNNDEQENQLTWQNVRIKSLEFLFFYLIPEFSKHLSNEETIIGKEDGIIRRSMESKILILKKYLNNEFVDGIVQEFVSDKPFGDSITMW